MKKASMVAIFVTTFFYLCCGCFGYAAFGNETPGNLLTGFGFYEPYWLIDFANACIVLHLVGGYQVLPVYIEIVQVWITISIFRRHHSFYMILSARSTANQYLQLLRDGLARNIPTADLWTTFTPSKFHCCQGFKRTPSDYVSELFMLCQLLGLQCCFLISTKCWEC